jgi:hypothetical protein
MMSFTSLPYLLAGVADGPAASKRLSQVQHKKSAAQICLVAGMNAQILHIQANSPNFCAP